MYINMLQLWRSVTFYFELVLVHPLSLCCPAVDCNPEYIRQMLSGYSVAETNLQSARFRLSHLLFVVSIYWIKQQSQIHRCALGCSCDVWEQKWTHSGEAGGDRVSARCTAPGGDVMVWLKLCLRIGLPGPCSETGDTFFPLWFTELLVPRRQQAHGSLPYRKTCHCIAPTAPGRATWKNSYWNERPTVWHKAYILFLNVTLFCSYFN